MLYLKELSIDRFKSFRHASLLFNKGFNCIVGPNASGKSNIVDALLFSLGESSLHRLRVNRLEQLITTTSNKKTGSLAKAHVTVVFAGDERTEISRRARADGKTVYRLNGKRMTRQEVLEVLKKHGVHIDETSTITQGEINKLTDLNPKGRRELIDLAAGIKEFEQKKHEALSELDRVGLKINEAQVMLNERLGFLNELEKEKEAAESFLAMSKRLKALNLSILTKRRKAVQDSIEQYAKEMLKLEARKKDLENKLASSAKLIQELSEERQRITKAQLESTNALSDTNKKLADIGNELNAIEVKIGTGNASAEEARKLTDSIQQGIRKVEDDIRSNEAEISSLAGKMKQAEARAKELGAVRSGVGGLTEDTRKAAALAQRLQKELDELRGKIMQLQSQGALAEARKAAVAKEIASVEESARQEKTANGDARNRLRELHAKKEKLAKDEASLQAELERLTKELDARDGEIIEMKQQRALARGRESSVQEKLRSAYTKQAGFYGTVSDICTYENGYAEAIEAAAGSHFNYFVVDSMDVANSMIQYLKKNNLGRATFIPLRELNAQEERRDKSLRAVVDLLKFDEKFRKVFAYVFNNTYLVRDIEEAKSRGIGSHRYVTMTGETVERSGILAGGSRPRALSLSTLEKRLADAEKASGALSVRAKEAGNAVFSCRKELALADMEISSLNSALANHEKRLESFKSNATRLAAEEAKAQAEVQRLKTSITGIEKESGGKTAQLEKARRDYESAYERSIEAARKGLSKEQMEAIEQANAELQGLRIKSAQAEQANAMLSSRKKELEGDFEGTRTTIDATLKEVGVQERKKAELLKAKARVEQEAKKSDRTTKQSYERLNAINSELDSLNNEQGATSSGVTEITKQLGDVAGKKGQMDVRMNDINAELAAYGNAEVEKIDEDVEKMEKEATVLGTKISELGNVNLKAPEAYEEKAKSVSEATEKVNTLESEKKAVLSMIDEIDSKKLNSFMATFKDVDKNFAKLYSYIFPGSARIELEDASNPLEGGLAIKLEDGKNSVRLDSKSGGEKSLISLMLIFAIHMCKPSSLYLFDEIDSALDKENSKKLSQLVKEMATKAQFVVVSHNDSLIVNADAAIGVVRSEGESKVVGIEISSVRNK